MINDKNVLAIIPARGGSKGVPRKNIKELAGKPLIAWTIEEAKKSKYIDQLVLTSEDPEIIEVAKSYGCEVPFVRPTELAQDSTPGMDPVIHAMHNLPKHDIVVLLQPTSPLRKTQDIDEAIEKCILNDGKAVVSVVESSNSPYWMYSLSEGNYINSIMKLEDIPIRRQEAPVAYSLNGAVYVSTAERLLAERAFLQKRTIAHIMPQERSFDIDTELDFRICETLLSPE